MLNKKLITLTLLSALAGGVHAQTLVEATAAYQEFVQAANANADKENLYNSLYRCYETNLAVLKHSANNSSDYAEARANLKDIMPYLPNGAAFMSGNAKKADAVRFAQAFVDLNMMVDFADVSNTAAEPFPQLAYYASANLVNTRRYADAIPYLQAYIHSGQEKYRKSVFANLIKACNHAHNKSAGLQAAKMAVASYADDFNMVSSAVNFCIDNEDDVNLQYFVAKALELKPEDETLLNIQGKLYEDAREYEKSLQIYTRLLQAHPNALDVAKHMAIGYYNLGVMSYNKAIAEVDATAKVGLTDAYVKNFTTAAEYLEKVVVSDPMSLKYTQALAVAYNCNGNKTQFALVNNKLASMGGGRITSDFVPTIITFASSGGELAQQNHAGANVPGASQTADGDGEVQQGGGVQPVAKPNEIPAFSVFARKYIEDRVNKWQGKDAYETVSEYRNRVTEKTREAKIKEVKKQAEQEYIRNFQVLVNLYQMDLKPYDAENGVFLITSKVLGNIIVPVPRENNEARSFESNWSGMQFLNPVYFIENDHLALAQLTIVTPTGKSYKYDNAAALAYTETEVDVNFAPIDANMLANTNEGSRQRIEKQQVHLGTSDVDLNIPVAEVCNDSTFAVIIANEHYANVAGVPMALNDGAVFAQYCEKTLGMPRSNVRTYSDASFGTMLRAIRDIKDIATAFEGKLNIVFYYAGHGIPNESTRDAYLLPVDADGKQTEGCYSLNRLYAELGSTHARSVVVFLDACFSGAQREGGMLASARGIALKPKKEDPRGNMVVFSAASDDETAYPYEKEGHGLFTYYLLKKLQETKGDVSLGELSQFISDNVKRQSVVINHKMQTPTATPSTSVVGTWQDMRMK